MLPPEIGGRVADPPPEARADRPAASCAGIGEEAASVSSSSEFQLAEIERATILRALEHTRGHRNQATELLGISIRTLRNKLGQYRQEGTLPAEFQ